MENNRSIFKIVIFSVLLVIVLLLALGIYSGIFQYIVCMLPTGEGVNFLNTYKYKHSCPTSTFWLEYDKDHLTKMNCGINLFSPYATLHFINKPGSYNHDDIVDFAEKNGWKYHLSITLNKDEIEQISKRSIGRNSLDELWIDIFITNPSPFWISNKCELLAFETDAFEKASYVFISDEQDKMSVRYIDPVLPGPINEFRLADIFYTRNSLPVPCEKSDTSYDTVEDVNNCEMHNEEQN